MSSEITPELIWSRILANQGEFFQTHRDRWFTYRIDGDLLCPSHADQQIPRSDFEIALRMLPQPVPQKLAKHVTGYEYVWAIMNDERISQGAW